MPVDLAALFGLDGKRAAITGGGGELCGVMAEAFASLGAKVALLDVDEAKAAARAQAIERDGGVARALRCSVLDERELERCYRGLCDEWGGIDLLVNGAGGNSPSASTDAEYVEPHGARGPSGASERGGPGDQSRPGGRTKAAQSAEGAGRTFFDLPSDGFRDTFDLNFFGTFLATKVFARGMAERQTGAVLNISSMSAFTPLTKVAAYSAAKAAVANFTQWLAVHLSHAGVRVNAIAPGFFMTEQLRFLHIDKESGEYTPRARKVVAHTPMGRYGDPVDLLSTVIWLLSDGARFVTGVVVPIDGGFSSYSI